MRVIDMADIIRAMQNETQFVLRCEEVFHDKISSAAASILSAQPHKPFVCLTGPSGSGKTTTAMRLKAYLENLGVKVCQLSMDNFFLPLDQRPPEATDWESPYCVNRELLLDTVDKLSRGETAQVPWYDFKNNKTGGYTPMEGSREVIIIAEGIHMLNPLLFDPMRSRATGVYVAPRTRIITPDDRIVKPEQVRVARRMIRDYLSRGRTLRETVLGVYFFGCLSSFLFSVIFGGFSLYLQYTGQFDVYAFYLANGLPNTVSKVVSLTPLHQIMSPAFLICCTIFLTTTIDAATRVMASMSSKEILSDQEPSVTSKYIWCISLSILVLGVLLVGGLEIIQALVVLAAIPLLGICVIMNISMFKAVREDFPNIWAANLLYIDKEKSGGKA